MIGPETTSALSGTSAAGAGLAAAMGPGAGAALVTPDAAVFPSSQPPTTSATPHARIASQVRIGPSIFTTPANTKPSRTPIRMAAGKIHRPPDTIQCALSPALPFLRESLHRDSVLQLV